MLRELAGALLAGLVLDVATAVSQAFVFMIVVLTTASCLGLSAQMAAVAELLRLQAILRDAMQGPVPGRPDRPT